MYFGLIANKLMDNDLFYNDDEYDDAHHYKSNECDEENHRDNDMIILHKLPCLQ